jgi:hypothetical protein
MTRFAARDRVWLALLLLAGAVVYLPAIRSPYFLDDYVHASMANGTFPLHRHPLDLYNFVDERERPVLWARGMVPWWADPRLSIRFFRPLSSALIWAEHRLLGDGPLLLHVHSFLWWALAVLGARALFVKLLPSPRVAALATAIFALAPCHAFPLGWLANREVLVSAAFGWPALGAYLRFREGRSAWDAALAMALFGASLLAGEYSLCFAGYVVAYELFAKDRLFARSAGLLAYFAPAATYLAARARFGYGARGSGFYSDPFREPVAFFTALPRRLMSLVLEGWFSLDHDTITGGTKGWAIAAAFFAALALCAAPIVELHRDLDEATRKTARWLLVGSLLALFPVTAVIASPRVLGVGFFGVAATVALLLERVWFTHREEVTPRPFAEEHARTCALALGFAHLVHGPLTSHLVSRSFRKSATDFAQHSQELYRRSQEAGESNVVVLRGMAGSLFLPWLDRRDPSPPFLVLAQTGHVLALRQGPRSIELLMPPSAGAFSIGSGNLFRGESTPMAPGDVFTMPGLRITVRDVGPMGPRRVSYEFDRELEASSLAWVTEDHSGFPDATLPAPGFGQPFDP